MLTTSSADTQPPRTREGFGAIRRSDIEGLAGLPTSAKWLWTCLKAIVPPWGRRVARSDLAKLADLHHRTVRRGIDRLEEAGLIAIDRTAGGAHASTNTIWIVSGERVDVDEPAPSAPAAPLRGPEISTPAVATPPVSADPENAPPPPEVLAELRRYAAVEGGGIDVDEISPKYQRHLAESWGIPWPTVPDRIPASTGDADRMVREFHDQVRGDKAHDPLVREVRRAQKLLDAHGRDAWSIVSRACEALKKAGLHERAGTFLYLGPWITRAGGRWT